MKCRDTAWTSRLMFWYKLWIYKPQIKIWVLLPAGWNRDGCNYLSISTWKNEQFPRFGLLKIKRNETQWNKKWGTESLDTRLYLLWYMQELLFIIRHVKITLWLPQLFNQDKNTLYAIFQGAKTQINWSSSVRFV